MERGKIVKEGSRLFVVVQIYNDGLTALNKRYHIHPDTPVREDCVGEEVEFDTVYIGILVYAKITKEC